MIHKIAHPWPWERSTTDSNAPLMPALHLPHQNLPSLVPQQTKRSGAEQNNYTVTGPSSIKGRLPGEVKKPLSLLEHGTDGGIRNEFRTRPMAILTLKSLQSSSGPHFLQSSPQKSGPSRIQTKTYLPQNEVNTLWTSLTTSPNR